VPTLAGGGLRVVVDDATPQGRLVATYELRPDARWQDGEPITAEDVKLAFDTDRTAPAGTERRWMAERVERVEIVDDRRVRFVYRAGERWDLYPLAPHILPAHLLANATTEKRATYDREPMHAGPFAVAAWIRGFGMTLSSFPKYVGGPAGLGRIEVRFYPDRGSVVDALRRGEVDIAPSPAIEPDLARTLDRFADGTRLQSYYTAATAVEMLRIGRRPLLADDRVRAALLVAIDRRAIVDSLFAGKARVPRSFVAPPHWAASEPLPVPRVDRDGARALLAAAGFRPGNLGILERNGERMVVTLQVATGSQARVEAGRRVASDLAASGIATNVHERPLADVRALIATGDFDLALVPEESADPQQASERYRGWIGPWFDVLVDAAASAGDRADKRLVYGELQRLWADALPGIPVYQQLVVDVAPRALDGIEPSPYGDPLTWNASRWRFVTNLN
jgi:peptide/nickel transport system substrate-binding protein